MVSSRMFADKGGHWMHIAPIERAPDNLEAYIDEVAWGMGALYGHAAGEKYRRTAPKLVAATMRLPRVQTFAALSGGDAAGLCMSVLQGMTGRIAFVHVLKPHCGQDLESLLAAEAAAALRREGVDEIVSECIPFCAVDMRGALEPLGFETIPRELMAAPTELISNIGAGVSRSSACGAMDMRAAGEAIAAAYAGDPGQKLHAEVRSPGAAEAYLEATLQGAHGLAHPEYCRVLREGDRVDAVIAGCEAAPGVGFILQVAVRPEARNRGLGASLIRDLATCFLKRGLKRTALGVTRTNPARGLYLRLGFGSLREVDAFVWRRP